mgnify:FL=1
MKSILKISLFIISIFLNASASSPKNITFLIAEREYKTVETLPHFAKQHLSENFSRKFCRATNEGEKRNQLSNPSAIGKADLLFISVRRRAFKEETMELIRSHIAKGKPIIGIRTASHAFQLRKETLPSGHQEWPEWDREIIGGNYNGHYGKELICTIQYATNSRHHPLLKKVKIPFSTPASLYRNSPLPNASTPLLLGSVKGFPPEPVAWVHQTPAKGKVFYTSLGHEEDFKKPTFNQLLINAINWCLENE